MSVGTLHATGSPTQGAVVFMQYCAGCHSLKEVRYPQLLRDLGPIQTFYRNANDLRAALPAESARRWLGRVPPDLSTIADVKGPAALSRYLNGFYPDPSRPFGVNHFDVPNVCMPDVLAQMRANDRLTQETIADVVAFLRYVADPSEVIRYRIGAVVIGFLAVVLICIGLAWSV